MARPRFAEPFGIVVEQTGEVALLRVTGELVAEWEETVDATISQVVADGAKQVLVDLRHVSFIDSLGVRALIRNQLRARDGGFSFAVVPGRGQVFRVVKTMGLDRVLRVLDDGAAEASASAT
jgi:anti-sigma B factor antagonist